MSNVALELVETLSDQRSNEKTYTLRVLNSSSRTILIHSVTPRIPEGVKLIEVRDVSIVGKQRHRAELLGHLERLVQASMLKNSETFRVEVARVLRELWAQMISPRFFVSALFRRPLAREAIRSALEPWQFRIMNVADAIRAREKFLIESDQVTVDLYEAKVEQLGRIEQELDSGGEVEELAQVAPDSFFAVGYSLRFPTSYIDSRKYVIAIDVAHSEVDSPQRVLSTVSESVIVNPRPVLLSIVAIVAGVLGAVVSATISTEDNNGVDFDPHSFVDIGNVLMQGKGLAGPVLALVIFNIYEHLELGRLREIGASWRSALLIGTLCGLFSDRIIDALAAIVGAG